MRRPEYEKELRGEPLRYVDHIVSYNARHGVRFAPLVDVQGREALTRMRPLVQFAIVSLYYFSGRHAERQLRSPHVASIAFRSPKRKRVGYTIVNSNYGSPLRASGVRKSIPFTKARSF